ncbi:helix-turn-helix transcriptional regulator [Mycobacterium sp. 94-17]|uniref:helix-turn-helix transcriptional regulator n=1 Tax=Mycobacterium sp. 94-17 TaxID=2986147 RepID=UPI002D1F7A06|nr:helix-turn-helix transcriptional regulator [Mycobacterium sp. 94-17]MEB4210990.1 helix-turn-helix transcriptional regulator [Mycobacterium sp. 94-17]
MGSDKWGDHAFGDRLKRYRERNGWTQVQLAEQLSANGLKGMTGAQVYRIEKGERSVRAVEAGVLADLYGVSVDALLGKRARPKADLLDAVMGLAETVEYTGISLRSLERALREAAETLADADTEGRYADLVEASESAREALALAADTVELADALPSIHITQEMLNRSRR